MKAKPWEKLKVVSFKGAYKTFLTKTFKLPNGTIHDFDIWYLEHGWIGVFALTDDMQVITATSFRPGPERVLREMVFGIVDPGEDSTTSAARELREETGYVAGKIITLGENMAWMPYAEGNANYYLAVGCKPDHEQSLDDTESIQVETIPLREYVETVLRTGNTSHAECGWLAIDFLLRNGYIQPRDIN